MGAAPVAISQEAAVIDVDGTVLREGSNGWTCITEVAPDYGYPMCNDEVWMELWQAILDRSDFSTDRIGPLWRQFRASPWLLFFTQPAQESQAQAPRRYME